MIPLDAVDARRDGSFALDDRFADAVLFAGGAFHSSGLHDTSHYSNHGAFPAASNQRPSWQWNDLLQRWELNYFTDGFSDHVNVPANRSMQFTSAYTIALWLRVNVNKAFQPFVVRGNGSVDDIEFYAGAAGELYFLHNRANGGSLTAASVGGLAALVPGKYAHVAITYDVNSSPKWRFYKDGLYSPVTFFAGDPSLPPPIITNQGWILGGATAIGFLEGQQSDVLILPRALSGSEIALLADPTYHPIRPTFARYWTRTPPEPPPLPNVDAYRLNGARTNAYMLTGAMTIAIELAGASDRPYQLHR
jgi:hypothetical protein